MRSCIYGKSYNRLHGRSLRWGMFGRGREAEDGLSHGGLVFVLVGLGLVTRWGDQGHLDMILLLDPALPVQCERLSHLDILLGNAATPRGIVSPRSRALRLDRLGTQHEPLVFLHSLHRGVTCADPRNRAISQHELV